MTVCSAPTWRATAVAASVSSSTPPVATVYVRRPGACSAMNDARSDESIPPDWRSPYGTSPPIRAATAAESTSVKPSIASSKPPSNTGDVVAVPVQVVGDEPAVLEDEAVRRLHDRDVAEHRAALHGRPEADDVDERALVDLARHRRVGQDRLRLAREADDAVLQAPGERAPAHPVAGDHQSAAPLVPQADGPVALERVDEVDPVLLVEVRDHLGVGLRREAVAALLELGPERAEVVDLAVERHPDGSVLVRERLLPGDEVGDRQPAVAEPRRPRGRGCPSSARGAR